MKNTTQFHIRPARPEEAGLFYTPHPEEDKRLGTVGHVRMDFGRSGNEFWHTWWPRGPEELNSPAFNELREVVDTMREDVLKSRFAMERFCYDHGGKIAGGYVQNYGYIVETEHYRYCLRCNPTPGDYNAYLTCFDLDVQRQNMEQSMAFLDYGDVPISNNLAENAIRPFVVGRKNWLFCDSVKGAESSAIVYSLVETAKANGIEPYGYLLLVLSMLPYLGKSPTHEELEKLMPWHPAVRHREHIRK